MKGYTVGLYEKAMPGYLSWRDKLRAAKNAGYDYIEISIDETEEKLARLDMEKKERLQLLELMYEEELPIRTMCLSGHRKYPLGSSDEQTAARGMEIMEKAILLADDLGVRLIQIAGYDVYYEDSTQETQKRFAENLKKAVQTAAAYGVMLEFETMETEFINTVWKAMFFVRQINSPYLGIYPDCGNIRNAAVKYGNDIYADLQSGQGHLTSLHLKETVPGQYRDLFFGNGQVDFRKTLHTAWELGIRKYVTEFWYQGNTEWGDDLHRANRMMREIIDTIQQEEKACWKY